MTNATIAAVIATLEADPALRTLLGGAGRVRFGHLPEHEQIPGVYVTGGSTNTATPGFGYRATPAATGRIRACGDTVQVDAWAAAAELAGDIKDRFDPVVFAGIAGLTGLRRIGGMDPTPDPDRPGLWHATARYAFEYTLRDTS